MRRWMRTWARPPEGERRMVVRASWMRRWGLEAENERCVGVSGEKSIMAARGGGEE